MKNEVRIYAFSKTNMAAEKRFDKWLRENDISGQLVKIWHINHEYNFKGRTRYVTTVEIEINGQRFDLKDGTDYANTFDAWGSIDADSDFKVDRFKSGLLESVCDERNAGLLLDFLAGQQEEEDN